MNALPQSAMGGLILLLALAAGAAQPPPATSGKDALTSGARVAVIGRETIDGKPQMLLNVQRGLESALRRKGYRIYDFKQLKEKERVQFFSSARDLKKLKNWQKRVQADFLLDYKAEANFKHQIDLQGHPAYNYQAKVDCRVIDFQTAEVLKTLSVKTQAAGLDPVQAAHGALSKSARELAGQLSKAPGKSAVTKAGASRK